MKTLKQTEVEVLERTLGEFEPLSPGTALQVATEKRLALKPVKDKSKRL